MCERERRKEWGVGGSGSNCESVMIDEMIAERNGVRIRSRYILRAQGRL
jgi:hypothetical protein